MQLQRHRRRCCGSSLQENGVLQSNALQSWRGMCGSSHSVQRQQHSPWQQQKGRRSRLQLQVCVEWVLGQLVTPLLLAPCHATHPAQGERPWTKRLPVGPQRYGGCLS